MANKKGDKTEDGEEVSSCELKFNSEERRLSENLLKPHHHLVMSNNIS